MLEYDFLIVGQGLAGTLLTYFLQQENKKVFVISNNNENNSSEVAAGMFNPVGGKRMLKTWMAEELLECVEETYPKLEKLLDSKFYNKQNILHTFQDEKEKIQAEKRLEDEDVSKYISLNNEQNENLKTEYGALNVIGGGWVNTKILLRSFRKYLKENNSFLEEDFNYSELIYKENKWNYKNYSFDKVVFCEGYKATNNPFFNELPFLLSKGEVISFNANNLPKETILKKGIYMVDLGNDTFKSGTTYEWKDLTETPTQSGLEKLTTKLDNFLNVEYAIKEHWAGVRPTVSDKKPILGEHNKNKGVYIFNGLGTKGVMLSPYFANQMKNYLVYSKDLISDVDVNRFYK